MDKISVLMTMIPALPLVAALLCALAGPRLLRQYCHVPVILCLAGSFVGSFLLFLEVRQRCSPTRRKAAVRRPVRSRGHACGAGPTWRTHCPTRERRRRTMVSVPAVTFASTSYCAPMR